MSYRGDLYTPENIIGYTGNINNNPTVYFQKGYAYGHITQAHGLGHNVGREEVRQAVDYDIRNVHGTCHEYAGGRCFHESRSMFVSVGGLGFASKFKLSVAISKFNLKKQWGDLSGEDQGKVLDGRWGMK
jgi:hypothetical protein